MWDNEYKGTRGIGGDICNNNSPAMPHSSDDKDDYHLLCTRRLDPCGEPSASKPPTNRSHTIDPMADISISSTNSDSMTHVTNDGVYEAT